MKLGFSISDRWLSCAWSVLFRTTPDNRVVGRIGASDVDAGNVLMLAEIFADACATVDDFEKARLDERSEALFEEWTDIGVDWIRF